MTDGSVAIRLMHRLTLTQCDYCLKVNILFVAKMGIHPNAVNRYQKNQLCQIDRALRPYFRFVVFYILKNAFENIKC